MYNHEPADYQCPFCAVVAGAEGDFPLTNQGDIVYQDDLITAFISSHWWPKNPGHVLIIPNQHAENLYDIPDDILAYIHSFSKRVAIALKGAYDCDGVSVRQHNEEAGNQDVWHYHLHVFPRFKNDQLYLSHNQKALAEPGERARYAAKLRPYLQ